MATTFTAGHSIGLSDPFVTARATFRSAIRRPLDAFALQRRYTRTCDALNALSDRNLADLGFVREDVPAIAHRSVYES